MMQEFFLGRCVLRYLLLVFCLGFLFLLPLAAQNKPVVVDQVNVINNVPQGVAGFFYGNTQPWILKENLYLKDGQIFENKAKFDEKIEDVRSSLGRNALVQADYRVEVALTPGADQTREMHVTVTIYISDSFNFIAYPRASLSSSKGTDIGLRFRHYNPFGFMQQWTGRMGYAYNEDGRSSFDFNFSGAVPFYWLGQGWNVTFGTNVLIAPWYGSINDTLSEEVPFTFQIGLNTVWQLAPSYHDQLSITTEIYQKVDVIAGSSDLATDYDPYVLSSGYNFYFKLPIYDFPSWGGLIYSLSAHGGRIAYRLEEEASDSRRGYFPYFAQIFRAGQVDLVGNMRKGISFDGGAWFDYNAYRGRHWGIWGENAQYGKDEHPWRDSRIWLTGTGFLPLHEYVAITGRVGWEYFPFDTANKHDMGGVLRGIRDHRLVGDMMFYWNFDIMFKGWVGQLDILGEFWLSIFYDGGLSRQPRGSFGEPFHAMGIEVIYYPKFSRNIRVRVSLGEDIQAMYYNGKLTGASPRDGQSQYELYLGIDLHY